MDVFDLFAKLSLDPSEYEKGLGEAEKKATGGGSKIGSALGGAAKVAGAAVAAASTAVVALGKSSVDAGMQFDTAISQVAATMGKTVEEMTEEVGHADTAYGEFSGNLREFAQFLGANTAFSATQAAEALNYMALAGYKTQESMDMLPSVLSLAAAGNFDLARASDMVTDAQTAFGIDAQRTAQMVDEMAKAASTGNTSVEQLGDAFLVVGGLAQELNGGMVTLADGTQQPVDGLQELEIALTAMANAGVKGSEAGTHMRNMLLKLSSPTKEGVEALEALGVSVFDADGKMRSLNDIFGDLNTSLGTLTQEEKIQAVSDLFNVRDMASAEALLNAVGEDWDKIGAKILEAKGAAAQMAETQLDNLAGDMTLFQSALEGAKIAISDGVTPTLREFVKFGTQAVSELGTAFREDGLEGALNALGPVIDRGIGLLFEKLPAVLDAAVALLDALVSGIITNLPKLVPAAVQLLERIVNSISDNIDKIIDSAVEIILALADGLIDTLPKLIPAIVQIIVTIVEKLTEPETLTKLVLAAVEIIIALANGLIQAIPQLLEAIPQIISNLVGAIIANLPTILSAGVQILVSLVTGILGALPQIIALAPEILVALAGGIVQGIQTIVDIGKQVVDGFLKGISDAWNGMVNNVKKFFTGFIDVIKGLFGIHSPSTVFAEIGKNLLAGFLKGISENVSSITEKVRNLKESISNIFRGLADAAVTWGRDLIGGFVNGLQEKLQALRDKAVDIAQQIKDVIGFSEPKEGPLSKFHTFAPDMMQLWAKGIKDNEHLVIDAITNAADFGGAVTAAGFSSGTVVGMGGARSIGSGPRMQTIILQVGRTELARLVHELNGEEDERIGLKLVTT